MTDFLVQNFSFIPHTDILYVASSPESGFFFGQEIPSGGITIDGHSFNSSFYDVPEGLILPADNGIPTYLVEDYLVTPHGYFAEIKVADLKDIRDFYTHFYTQTTFHEPDDFRTPSAPEPSGAMLFAIALMIARVAFWARYRR
jgi:hypothetical protein